jgi:hypothetical protein
MRYDEGLAMAQGWLLVDNDEYGIEIERYQEDPQERFKTDLAALSFVKQIAEAGDEHAKYCLQQIPDIDDKSPHCSCGAGDQSDTHQSECELVTEGLIR